MALRRWEGSLHGSGDLGGKYLRDINCCSVHLKKISIGDYDFLPARLASPTYRLVSVVVVVVAVVVVVWKG